MKNSLGSFFLEVRRHWPGKRFVTETIALSVYRRIAAPLSIWVQCPRVHYAMMIVDWRCGMCAGKSLKNGKRERLLQWAMSSGEVGKKIHRSRLRIINTADDTNSPRYSGTANALTGRAGKTKKKKTVNKSESDRSGRQTGLRVGLAVPILWL